MSSGTTMYISPQRRAVIAGRVTTADRALLEAAAAARGTTLSRYLAEVATQAARRDLLGQKQRREKHDG